MLKKNFFKNNFKVLHGRFNTCNVKDYPRDILMHYKYALNILPDYL